VEGEERKKQGATSALMRQIGWVEVREDFWLIVALSRSEDETEIHAGERTGDTSHEEHSSCYTAALFG
jgi:hypothetical protein